MNILVTGANGFVGTALTKQLSASGHRVIRAVRTPDGLPNTIVIGNIYGATPWQAALRDINTVIHLAARVHVMHEDAPDALSQYREVNVDGTLNLARQAAKAGVRRFIFLSSVKVQGEGSTEPYRETDILAPQGAYALSKWEAESGLRALLQAGGMEYVILRPTLIYGPGVGANFLRLLRWAKSGIPLPFSAIDNRRSLLYVGNLTDAICACLDHPAAAGQTYLVADGQDISTPQLLRNLARAMGRPARLLPVPPSWLQIMGCALGKRAEISRLTESLTVDISKFENDLGWHAPYSIDQGLSETIKWFKGQHVS